MSAEPDCPDRVTRQEDGSWLWVCPVDKEYYRGRLILGIKICLLIPLPLLALGAALSYYYDNWSAMLYIFLVAVFVWLLIFVIYLLLLHFMGDPALRYIMFEDHIQIGEGNSAECFKIKSAKAVVFTRKYIELRRGVSVMRVYVPEEDMDFVKDFILSRLSEKTEMWYE